MLVGWRKMRLFHRHMIRRGQITGKTPLMLRRSPRTAERVDNIFGFLILILNMCIIAMALRGPLLYMTLISSRSKRPRNAALRNPFRQIMS